MHKIIGLFNPTISISFLFFRYVNLRFFFTEKLFRSKAIAAKPSNSCQHNKLVASSMSAPNSIALIDNIIRL